MQISKVRSIAGTVGQGQSRHLSMKDSGWQKSWSQGGKPQRGPLKNESPV